MSFKIMFLLMKIIMNTWKTIPTYRNSMSISKILRPKLKLDPGKMSKIKINLEAYQQIMKFKTLIMKITILSLRKLKILPP